LWHIALLPCSLLPVMPNWAPWWGAPAQALGVETAEDVGQSVVLRFVAPLKPGKYDLALYCMPDSWVGCDYMQTLQIKACCAARGLLLCCWRAGGWQAGACRRGCAPVGAARGASLRPACAGAGSQRRQ
jgi:hypothetical protein